MEVKFNEQQDAMRLPEYVSSAAIAKFIGCGKRTVNRWLKDAPNLGIKVHSATGKHYRVLSRDEVQELCDRMKQFQILRKGKRHAKRPKRK